MKFHSGEAARPTRGLRAVVFDLDGTLVDSVPDIHAAAAAFLAERGYQALDLATITGFVGNGVPVLLERILGAVGEADGPAAVAVALPRFLEIYGAAPSALSRLYPGVAETLAELQAAGFLLGICTNKPVGPARQMIAELGIAGHFTALVGGDSLPQRKPDPAPLRHTAGLLGVDLGSLAYVGDSEVDAATAQAAGVPFLLFTEGYRKTPVAALPHRASFARFARLPGLLTELAGAGAL
ncbi:MAG: phosphoglycolate phosphatase [Kiloniellaceae bacterium]